MATVEITVDNTAFRRWARKYPSQVAFITSKAINKTALQVQKAARANLRKKFIIRRPTFADRSIKITRFAKKRSLIAEIEVTSPGLQKDIFSKFEEGGTKRGIENRRVAIPQDIVQDKSRVIPRSKRPPQLKRSFVITSNRGQDLIIQRKGRGSRSRTLYAYSLEPQVRIPRILDFHKTAIGVFNNRWQRNYAEEFAKAIRTIR